MKAPTYFCFAGSQVVSACPLKGTPGRFPP
jgi:hypothetical protein